MDLKKKHILLINRDKTKSRSVKETGKNVRADLVMVGKFKLPRPSAQKSRSIKETGRNARANLVMVGNAK